MYRSLELLLAGADDASLGAPLFGPRKIALYQTRDLTVDSFVRRVGTADAETANLITKVTTGYFLAVLSDYPVRVRVNGAGATQHTLNSNNVANVNVGAPLPDQCLLILTGQVTDVRLQPIVGATATANVKVIVTGDPTNAYT